MNVPILEPSRAVTSVTTTVRSSMASNDGKVQEKQEENQEVEKLYTARSKDRENAMSDSEVAK